MRLIPIFSLLLFLLTASVPDRARQANEAFENRDFQTAERLFREAINDNPNDSRLYFNHATTLTLLGRQEEAVQAFERFRMVERDPGLRAFADYNIGNIFAEAENWEAAAELYRMALLQNPADEDAIHNYEFALRQLGQQQEDQQELPPDEQQQQQQDTQDADQSEQQQESDPEEGEGRPGEQQSDPSDSRQSPEDTEPEPRPGEMSQQEAQQILNAITNRERELIRDFLKDLTPPAQTQEKDW
ncbi:MAG: tetratricopeptide repeat protein [Candidatus Cyclonatronum sp.]|uniref:tetratricopeptide repeat protein n=1 Tax=Cyclonatronum sp. TaxID=3024185 RepID=UPI0025BEA362|nr:tetratricopeptide repeat protein [Cyclonatronum sp.]MCC5934578.1 tetratricopeptide repeat protein [Balneolales bacterium]MCH8487381.1 tetratricopeptide repeat protein [Cyclonatronum sp.]